MKKYVKLKYHSVFKYHDHNETVKFESTGTIEEDNENMIIKVDNQDYPIELHFYNDHILLINDNATVKLIQDEVVENEYHSPYGQMTISTKLISRQNDEIIKLKYHLLDGDNVLSEVYLLINYQVLEN